MTASRIPEQPPSISIERISQRFDTPTGETIAALASIDLDIHEGEFVAVVGPSGCGKSTLLNIISGLLRPSEGTVRVRGEEVVGIRPDVGYMPAKDSLLPWRTVRQNVELPMEFQRKPKSEESASRVSKLMSAVGLDGFEDYYPHALSQGMKQRGAIARTFATEPEILLLDEPFSALDAQTRVVVQDLFLSLWERHKSTVVLITHDIAEAVALADHVVVMSSRPGEIIGNYQVELPRPRSVEHLLFEEPAFQQYLMQIWKDLRK